MPIRLILLGLVARGANIHQALHFFKCQGYSEKTALHLFEENGVRFPDVFNDLQPSPTRMLELQELSIS